MRQVILLLILSFLMVAPAAYAQTGADYDTLSEMAATVTSSDFFYLFDASEADGSRMKKVSFDATATNCLNGAGGWSAFQAPLAAGTDYLAPDGDGSGLTGLTPTNVTPVDTADENAAFFPLLVDGATGTQAVETDGEFYFNPFTNVLVAPNLWVTGTQFQIPSTNADPTAVAGFLRHDSTIANFTNGGVVYYNGAAIKQMIDMTTATAQACTDDQVVAYDADADLWYCKADADSGGATAINDIADAAADGTIDQTGYKQIWTSTLNTAGAVWTFTNTTADLTADVSFMDLKLTDDGDANGYFFRGYDNAGGDLQWYIGAGGVGYFVGGITIPQSATAQSAEYYEGSGDGADSHTISAQAMTADRVSYLPDYVIGFLASDQVDTGGDLADGSVDAVHISSIVESIAWNAAGTNSDGTQCADPAEATINSGPITYTTICADNDASTIYGHVVMPDSWDGGTVTMESEYIQTAADTGVLNGDIACMCRGAGETVNNTWGTEIAVDDAAVTGSNAVDMTTSTAITCDGTCAAGDTLYWRYQMDATGTTTAVATLHFVGWKMEYTSTVGD